MRLIYILILLTIFTSCKNEIKFDSKKWKTYADLDQYPYRESMLGDIVDNDRLMGLKYQTVIDSLGQPENYWDKKENELWYSVTVDYGTDIDPVYTKHLTVTIGSDSTVEKVEIKEWKY
jgi:hypothetical protein